MTFKSLENSLFNKLINFSPQRPMNIFITVEAVINFFPKLVSLFKIISLAHGLTRNSIQSDFEQNQFYGSKTGGHLEYIDSHILQYYKTSSLGSGDPKMDVSDENSKALLERSLYFLYMPLQYFYCEKARITALQIYIQLSVSCGQLCVDAGWSPHLLTFILRSQSSLIIYNYNPSFNLVDLV